MRFDTCLTGSAALGSRREELNVKLFGGADVLPMSGRVESVGSKNCAVALRILEEERLVLSRADLGGTRGRVIYFSSQTGEVLLRRLAPTELHAQASGRCALETAEE